MGSPVLSVLMMTYNHESYIREAVESVLNQNLPFSWELVVGNDASTDRTAEILDEMAAGDARIRVIHHEENMGLHRNYVYLIQQCNGEFVALLEGDDYWIDTEKCLLQVRLLKENPQMAWCFTDALEVEFDGKTIRQLIQNARPEMDLKAWLGSSPFINPPNNTILFRKSAEPQSYPDVFFGLIQWDILLCVLRSNQGKIGYIGRTTLAWRRHHASFSLNASGAGLKRYKHLLLLNTYLRKILQGEMATLVPSPVYIYEFFAIQCLKEKKYLWFLWYFLRRSCMGWDLPIRHYRDFFWRLRNEDSF
jgi:glycosyltransferase involved in cell wall biosynthesis